MEFVVLLLNMIVHAIILTFCIFLVYLAQPGSNLFSWHPALMSVSCGLLMMEGILFLSSHNSLLWKGTRSVKITAHWVIQVIAFLCTLIGFIVVVYNKIQHDKYHFVTWHAKLGLVTFIYNCIQMLGGVGVLYPKLIKWTNAANLKLGHALSGTVLFLLTCITILLGLYSNWFTRKVDGPVQVAISLVPVAMATTIIIQTAQHYMHRFKK